MKTKWGSCNHRAGHISLNTQLVNKPKDVTLEIEAEIPGGAPSNVVRTVTENSRSLKFSQQGFEKD